MNLLLDSHTLLWLMEGNPNLSATAAVLIADPTNRLHLSMASVWEISIKVGLKKMGLSVPLSRFLSTAVGGYGLEILPITMNDCVHYEALSFPNPQHRDPFDRMIVTHAQRNEFPVVGVDTAFDSYGIDRVW